MERLKAAVVRASMARKRRRFYPHSVNLTTKQIAWLRGKKNSSEILRKMIDGAITREKRADDKMMEKTLAKLWENWCMLMDMAQMHESVEKRHEYGTKAHKVMKEINDLRLEMGQLTEDTWLTWEIAWPRDRRNSGKSTEERRRLAEARLAELKQAIKSRAGRD